MKSIAKKIFASLILLLLITVASKAESVFWSENFETNAASRWTTNGTWKIGSPTTGPATNTAGYRTHTGSRCATTGLTGNAPNNVDRRLICTNYNGSPTLAIPDASQFPRLRFWQWFNFVNAGGLVEVQIVGRTNWTAITATNNSIGSTPSVSSGVWSRTSIDLGAFAGTNVLVAFRFASGGSGFGNDLGWYVDDVALVTGAPGFNNPESFEADLGDWAVENGTWEVGKPTSGPGTNAAGFRAHTGTNCAATVLGGNYSWFVDTRLISPPFVVPSTNRPALRFAQWYDFINAGGYVEVSSGYSLTNFASSTNYVTVTNINTGTNFSSSTNIIGGITNIIVTTNIFALTNINIIGTNITTTANVSTNNWQTLFRTKTSVGSAEASSGGWTNVAVDLSAFSGQTLRAAFHFGSGMGGFGNAAGWYVDDVSLVTAPQLTVPPTTNITVGEIFSTTASATNTSGPPTSAFTFALAAASVNAYITTNGVFNWTNTRPASGTNIFLITAAADGVPPVTTNSFTVIVQPPAFTFSASNTLAAKKYFMLSLQSLSNTTWRVDASTNLASVTNWRPAFTSTVPAGGLLLFTDRIATNYPTRFYRVTYP